MSKALVEIEKVSYSVGGHLILKDVTFNITKGDFLAVIGPNGSGKSTLIKIILGLLRPDSGGVRIMGVPIHEFHEWRAVGYVPQKATHVDPLFPISVREVVALGRIAGKRWPRWMGRDDMAAVELALDMVGMAGYGDRRINALSGGQQQRVFIARAIVNTPSILFLDEPTTGIDAGAQEDFYSLLDRLNREGITIVLVTHDIGVVNKHVSKVACLNQTLVFHGTHQEFCSSKEARALIPGEDHLVLHRH